MMDSAKVLSSGVVIQLDDTSVLTWLTNNQEFCRAISGLHWNSKYPTFGDVCTSGLTVTTA